MSEETTDTPVEAEEVEETEPAEDETTETEETDEPDDAVVEEVDVDDAPRVFIDPDSV